MLYYGFVVFALKGLLLVLGNVELRRAVLLLVVVVQLLLGGAFNAVKLKCSQRDSLPELFL